MQIKGGRLWSDQNRFVVASIICERPELPWVLYEGGEIGASKDEWYVRSPTSDVALEL